MGISTSQTNKSEPIETTDLFKETFSDNQFYYGPIIYTPNMDERRNPVLFQHLADESIRIGSGNDEKLMEMLDVENRKKTSRETYNTAVVDLLVDLNLNSNLKTSKKGDILILSGHFNCKQDDMVCHFYVSKEPRLVDSIKSNAAVVTLKISAQGVKKSFENIEIDISSYKPDPLVYLYVEASCELESQKSAYVANRQISILSVGTVEGSYSILQQKIFMGDTGLFINDIYGVENDQDGEEEDCVICMAAPRSSVVLPCKHLCTCTECGLLLASQQQKCPMCRQNIFSILDLKK